MRTISSNLKSDMLSGYRSILVKVTTKNNTVYGYTDHDLPLVVDGNTYVPTPGLVRGNMHLTVGEEVSSQEFGTAWIDAPEDELLAGLFDNASIEVLLCSWKNPSYGSFLVNKGVLGQIQWTSNGFSADVMGVMRNLQININFVVTGTCRHLLFSQYDTKHIGACTLNKVSYTQTGTISGINTQRLTFATSGISTTNNYCTNGIITFTSGENSGLKYEIKSHVGNVITLGLLADYDVTSGTTFTITAGCDKTFSTCKNKFNNVVNFGGFPHIQTEVQYR